VRQSTGDLRESTEDVCESSFVASQVDPAELELPKYRLHHPPRHPNLHNPLSEPPETMYQQALVDRAVTPAKLKKPVSRMFPEWW
jgi:hypothetical protein